MRVPNLMSLFLPALLVFMLSALPAGSQEDIIRVSDSAFDDRLRPPVPFNHDEHNETAQIEECSVCHHVYEEGRLVEDDSSEGTECSECHTLQDDDKPLPLVKVYHAQCKGCHQKSKAGPVMCSECHTDD